MEKIRIILFGYILGNLSILVHCCTLPTALTGQWDSSDKGALYFNSTAMSNYKVYDRGYLEFECVINNGDIYVFRSEQFNFFSSYAEAVICLKLETIKTSMYRYTLYTTQLQHADYERVKYVSTSATVTEASACDDTTNTESSLLVQNGALSSFQIQCPDTFLAQFSYSLDDNTDCINKTGSLDACTDLNTMTFNYTACSTVQAYSSDGSVSCVYSTTINSTITQLYVYNLDTMTDESTTYRFTCYLLESSGGYVYATQYPRDCHSTQNTTYVPSPGISLEMLASMPTTTEATTAVAAASLAVVAAAAGIGLILIIVGVLVSVFIYKKKKHQVDPRITDKGLPPTDTGMVGCLEEVDATDEVNAVLISGSAKTVKKPHPDPTPIVRQISLIDSFKSKFFKNSVHTIDRNITDDDKEVLKDNDSKKIIKPQIPCFEVTQNETNVKTEQDNNIRPSTSKSLSTRVVEMENGDIFSPRNAPPDPPPTDCVIEEMDIVNEPPLVLDSDTPRHIKFDTADMASKKTLSKIRSRSPEVNTIPAHNINSYEGNAFEDDDSKIAAKSIFSISSAKHFTPVESHIPKVTPRKVENVLDFLRGTATVVPIIEDEHSDTEDNVVAMATTWKEDFSMEPLPKMKTKQRKRKGNVKGSKKKGKPVPSKDENTNSVNTIKIPTSQVNQSYETENENSEDEVKLYKNDNLSTDWNQQSSKTDDMKGDMSDDEIKNAYVNRSVAMVTMSSDDQKVSSINFVHDDSCKDTADDKKENNMEIGNLTLRSLDSLDFGGINGLSARLDSPDDNPSIDGTKYDDAVSRNPINQSTITSNDQNSENPSWLKFREKPINGYDNYMFENNAIDSAGSGTEMSSSSSDGTDDDDEDDDNVDKSRDDMNIGDLKITENGGDLIESTKKKKKRRSNKSKKKRKKKRKSEKRKSKVLGKENMSLDMARLFKDDDVAGRTGRPDDGIQGLITKIRENHLYGIPGTSQDGENTGSGIPGTSQDGENTGFGIPGTSQDGENTASGIPGTSQDRENTGFGIPGTSQEGENTGSADGETGDFDIFSDRSKRMFTHEFTDDEF